jgi:hypothetical protein
VIDGERERTSRLGNVLNVSSRFGPCTRSGRARGIGTEVSHLQRSFCGARLPRREYLPAATRVLYPFHYPRSCTVPSCHVIPSSARHCNDIFPRVCQLTVVYRSSTPGSPTCPTLPSASRTRTTKQSRPWTLWTDPRRPASWASSTSHLSRRWWT